MRTLDDYTYSAFMEMWKHQVGIGEHLRGINQSQGGILKSNENAGKPAQVTYHRKYTMPCYPSK